MADARLNRSRGDRLILGVCAGVAAYFNLSVTLVRVLWTALALCGPAAIAYRIAAAVMPLRPE